MEIKQLNKLYEQILSKMSNDSEKGLRYFKQRWTVLGLEEREILKFFLARYITSLLLENTISVEIQMHWVAILNAMNRETEEYEPRGKLIKTKKISSLQIAKLFYDLKNSGYISNTLEEISDLVSDIFDLNESTIFTYLNEPNRFSKAKPLFG